MLVSAALVGLGTTGISAASEGRPAPTHATGPGVYIVTLAEDPSAVYDGGVRGYPPTRPESGRRFDHGRPAVTSYAKRLLALQERLLSRVGSPAVLYQMTTAVNGFGARLTGEQVKQLRAIKAVALVERSATEFLDTVESPDLLGLGRAWARHGGAEDAGRGTVVGVIDSGIWPENPSFAGLPSNSRGSPGQPAGFHGACPRGEQWDTEDCNDKVVSAHYFVKGFGADSIAESEFLSPRDGSGHGSHVASIAAGNDDVTVVIEGQRFGTASGMAPAARIAAYKACWTAPNPDDDGCATADTVAAIDQAVADGVDVLNYSISGSPDTLADSVGLAFLNAATAGVFVAASAGNEGPDEGTVSHIGPWVTTVGASTHLPFQGSVRLGDGRVHVGAMVSDEAVDNASLVLGSAVAIPTATRKQARICEVGSLDAASVEDRIVVCDRGVTARVDKSTAVARAGGAGMVLANVRRDSRDPDLHSVPTVHLDSPAADDLRSYIAATMRKGRVATASLDPAGSERTPVPQVSDFSSRGPSDAQGDGVLKPDLTAPGFGVLAAVAPPSSSGRLWDIRSSTSMSSAHVAGLAAFVRSEKPRWEPARIKSAMMTTAYDLSGGSEPQTQGAGHIRPGRFLDPGLVYDASAADWFAFLAGRVRAHDLNHPSISVGRMVGPTTVTRRVTNLTGRRETFRASVSGLRGVHTTVTPAAMTLAPGASKMFAVRFETGPGGPVGSTADGTLTWSGAAFRNRTRIPIVARPQTAGLTPSRPGAARPPRGSSTPGR